VRTTLVTTLAVVAAVGSGVIGGVLYAFSAFVMRGLAELPPERALAAMNGINRAAPRAPLVVPLVGTALVCVVLGVLTARHLDERGSWLVIAGCALYLVAFGVTMFFHVPRNDALLLVDPSSAGAAAAWVDYRGPWVVANHVRSLAAVAGSALLVASLVRLA
jgi:uncharacterized membrane protein